jgi:uncharacterized protein YbjT (DUF2867 family)
MILVTGAAGKTGRAVIRALVGLGSPVRAFVHREEHRASVRELGVQDVVVGDMRDEVAFGQATHGARAIYHLCPNVSPDEVTIGRVVIEAARASGTRRFIYHSVLHPQTESMPHHWQKLRVEEILFESGLNYTILQPSAYMQNILAGWTAIVERGRYEVPYPVETRLGMVDLHDVAAVAAKIVTGSGHIGATYELAGPEILTQGEVADILSRSLEQPVTAYQIPLSEWRQRAKAAGLGAYQIDTLVKMFRYYERHGFWGSPRVLGWLLNREPTRLGAFIEREKAEIL